MKLNKLPNNILLMNLTFHYRVRLKITLSFLLLLFAISSYAQKTSTSSIYNIEIKGLVRDAHTKQPISAAQISLLDNKSSAVADSLGQFSIKVSSLKDILAVKAYDYNNTETALKGRNSLIIELYSDNYTNYFSKLNSVNGKINNASVINGLSHYADFNENTTIAADEVMFKLGGNIRSIARSGNDGLGAALFIRGLNSINANAQPLLVVDGVIWDAMYDRASVHSGFYENILANIDVNDIDDITVLKDGTAIYGSKGSNGVILITTKRAKSMVTKIDLNIFTGMKTSPKSIPMMDGEQFRIYASELLKSEGVSAKEATKYEFLETDPSNTMVYNMYHNNTNWNDEVYQTGVTQNYNISVSGGDEKALYYLSLGYVGNKGIVKSTGFDRINSRFNADIKLAEILKIGLNIGYTQTERKVTDDGLSYSSATWISKTKSPFLSPYSYTSVGKLSTDYALTDSFNIGNPAAILEFSEVNKMINRRFNIGLKPTITITPEFSFSSNFDYSVDKTTERRFVPLYYTPEIYLSKYDAYSKNEINNQVMRNQTIFDESRLQYQKTFDYRHNLTAIWGWRYINNYYESDYIGRHNTGLNSTTTISTGNSNEAYWDIDGLNNHTKSLSNFVNVEYNYDGRYFANATVSVDGSSRFGRETQGGLSLFGHSWAVFPSIYGGWLISAEKFMKNIKFVNYLKLRGGYEQTGNDGIKDYESMTYFTSVRYMDKASGIVLSNIENSKVQWETTGKASVGIDMNIFKDRLSISLDGYFSTTSNLLMYKDLEEFTGLEKYLDNGGTMSNNGYEINLKWKTLNLKNFKWELGASIGHYVNKITALPYGSYTTSAYGGELITEKGQSAAVFYGYKTKGVFSTTQEAEAAGLKILNSDGSFTYFQAGDVIFDDVDGNYIINDKDKQIIGNPNPKFYGTLSSNMYYKHFTLKTIFAYNYGNKIYNYQRRLLESGSDFSNQTTALLRRWTAEGQVTNQPKSTYSDPMGNSRFSDRWIEDGSYVKLKTVSLSYDIAINNNAFIQGVTIWASANNLFSISKYLGVDPEVSAGNSIYYQGIDAGFIPTTKSYYLGVKFNL